MDNSRRVRQTLKELEYNYRSVGLFLEHLDLRFAKLLPQLEGLLRFWPQQQQQQQALELELSSTSHEMRLLERELQTLERALEQQKIRQLQDYELSLREQKTQLLQLEQIYAHLMAELEEREQRLEEFSEMLSGLLEEAPRLQALNEENRRLQAAIESFEMTEQEYLRLLEEKNQQQIQLKRLYEGELEQLSTELQRSHSDQQQQQNQSQNIGKSLARMAQERNSIRTEQQELQQNCERLETENQALQQELDSLREQQAHAASLYEELSGATGRKLMAVCSYQAVSETLQGLGYALSPELGRQLAAQLHLSLSEYEHLEPRIQLQPGPVAQFFAGLEPQSLSSLPEQPPLGTAQEAQWQYAEVPAGLYPLGDDLQPAERPAHAWQTEGFQLARLLVTNANYADFIAAGGYADESLWLPEGWRFIQSQNHTAPAFWNHRRYYCGEQFPDYPVIGVSWYEADAFARWSQAELPSEAQWEAAGRGVEGLRWPWGNRWQEECANTADAGVSHPTPVGAYPAGASPLGCLDMIGNVFEWTRSLYRPYPYREDDGREELTAAGARTLRGCSWNHRGGYFTRLSYRFQADPTTRHSDIGFRLGRPLPVTQALISSEQERVF